MVQILLIAATSVYCGIACGHRNIPVPIGIVVAIIAGLFGGVVAGLIGSLGTCFLAGFVFAMIPIPRETEPEDVEAWRAAESFEQKVSDQPHEVDRNPYSAPRSTRL